jgi:hypothetical protein
MICSCPRSGCESVAPVRQLQVQPCLHAARLAGDDACASMLTPALHAVLATSATSVVCQACKDEWVFKLATRPWTVPSIAGFCSAE